MDSEQEVFTENINKTKMVDLKIDISPRLDEEMKVSKTYDFKCFKAFDELLLVVNRKPFFDNIIDTGYICFKVSDKVDKVVSCAEEYLVLLSVFLIHYPGLFRSSPQLFHNFSLSLEYNIFDSLAVLCLWI